MINRFKEEYYFLSNFSDSVITINGFTFKNGESAYQSFKNLSEQHNFVNLEALEAKKKGKKVKLREDWDKVKDKVMYDVVKAKFTQNEDLKQKLLDTGDEILLEGNWHCDNYWGNCNCYKCKGIEGFNMLGKILMLVRKGLK